jgi:D-arabinose 1-dehydrogenase-like Zn-dependent alcohol dehydrogenase
VQLLAARGATVVATGAADDVARLTGLGATTVVDYAAGSVPGQVLAVYPDGVDALIDLVSYGPDGLALSTVRKGGKVASTLGAATGEAMDAAGLTGTNVMAGTLRVDVSTVLPLERAVDGLATIAAGLARGKIVIEVSA